MFFYERYKILHNIIYKIISSDDWEQAKRLGLYSGSKDDLRDGFIHFSSKDQVEGTLKKHFNGQKGLLLLSINVTLLLGNSLKWEVSRNGAEFPHLYDDLNLNAVIKVEEIPDIR